MNNSDQSSDHSLAQSVHGIFGTNFINCHKPKLSTKASNQELEFALAVLLVDLASIDQNFDMNEYHIIQSGLNRVFGTTPAQVTELINRAQLTLGTLRGSSKFAEKLRDSLSEDARKQILELIDQVIMADGEKSDFEIYLRSKFKDLLGI